MKNQFKKVLAGAIAFAGVVGSAAVAHGQAAFSTTTAITTTTTMISETALIIGGVIAVILSLYTALVGLGWAKRKFSKHVSGRKF